MNKLIKETFGQCTQRIQNAVLKDITQTIFFLNGNFIDEKQKRKNIRCAHKKKKKRGFYGKEHLDAPRIKKKKAP